MHVRISGSGLTPKMKTYKKLPPNGLVHESDIKYKKPFSLSMASVMTEPCFFRF